MKRQITLTKTFRLVCILMSALLFFSCEQDLNIEIKTNDRRLLIHGEFTTDSVVHSIRLNCSGSIATGRPQEVVTGAQISVTDQIETFSYVENKESPGLYQTQGACCGKGGHIYSLTITNVDIDGNGKYETYVAQTMMPVPITFDSLVTKRGLNGDGNMALNNYAYYKLYYNGPNYVYKSEMLNSDDEGTSLTDRLGTGEIIRDENEFKVPKVLNPGSFINRLSYLSINSTVVQGDTISFICYNFTTEQFEFLKEFDNNTSSDNPFNSQNIFDQLKIPTNLPTNIEPSDKAAGYFFIYSISKISKVFEESNED